MTVTKQISSIFQEVFDDPGLLVGPWTTPDEITDWDSVAQVKLVLAIEEAFGVRFTTDEVAAFSSVGDFITTLNKRTGGAG